VILLLIMTSRQKIQPVALVDERIPRYLYPLHQLLDDGAACYMIERAGSLEPKVQFDHDRKGGHLATCGSCVGMA